MALTSCVSVLACIRSPASSPRFATREEHGVEAIIKPATWRSNGTLSGTYRPKMPQTKLKRSGYGKRWHIERFFSGLKRTTGSELSARTDLTLHHEAAF